VAAELERIESTLSHWRPMSETSQLNASQTTLEIECSKELASLVSQARELSEATDGAFDITVGPLVDAWGYGPSGPKVNPPSDETIRKLLASTGWKKLEVDDSVPSLRKQDPEVQIDLGAMLQGYAVDRVHTLLAKHGLKEFLIEIGGELRAAGGWEVALDPSAGAWVTSTFTLRDRALSTSGVYRRGPKGEEKHVISPRTGRPAETKWRAIAVVAPTCREADGWDTALLVAEDARSLAEARGLNVQLVPSGGGAGIKVGEWSTQ
jgi:thiamine biosynthesis lipoprotein